MLYTSCSEYKAKCYPFHWNKINDTLGFVEHAEDKEHWPPYEDNDSRSALLNVIFSFTSSKKINNAKKIKWFIETGTCNALTCMHVSSVFEKVSTVEKYKPDDSRLPDNFYRKVKDNFKNIDFYQGDSVTFIKTVLSEAPHARACFWLDAHNGVQEVPLIEELNAIKESSEVKDHLILIDDACDCGQGNFPAFPEIANAIRKINPEYNVVKVDHCRGIIVGYVS